MVAATKMHKIYNMGKKNNYQYNTKKINLTILLNCITFNYGNYVVIMLNDFMCVCRRIKLID